jgi:hypothetical protein
MLAPEDSSPTGHMVRTGITKSEVAHKVAGFCGRRGVTFLLIRIETDGKQDPRIPDAKSLVTCRAVQVVLFELSGAFVGRVNQTLERAQSGIVRCTSFCKFLNYLVAVFDPDDVSRSHIGRILCFDSR